MYLCIYLKSLLAIQWSHVYLLLLYILNTAIRAYVDCVVAVVPEIFIFTFQRKSNNKIVIIMVSRDGREAFE